MISLSKKHLKEIQDIAESSYPFECCGILAGTVDPAGDRRVLRLLPARNERADSPRNRYLISPKFVLKVDRECQDKGHQILGFFHSHPDVPARPSSYDREHAWPWYAYIIVSVLRGRFDKIAAWQLKDNRSEFEEATLQIE